MKRIVIAGICMLYGMVSLYAQQAADSLQINTDTVLTRMASAQPAYRTLSVRARLQWDDGKNQQDFQANIRMLKDSLVWMSLTGGPGVEGARVLMNRDSFRLINKMTGEYAVRDFGFMGSWLMFPISFDMLQQLIAGQKISIGEKAVKAVLQDSTYVVYCESDKMLEKIWVNTGNYTPAKLLLKDKLLRQDMTVNFDAYKDLNGKPFSYRREISVNRDGVQLKLDIDITKVRVNDDLSYPFEVSEKYKRVE